MTPDEARHAMGLYREYFAETGIFENEVYEGVPKMLSHLKNEGKSLMLATSKPEDMSIEILDKFGLSPYFEKICGATRDGVRSEKAEVIAYLLESIPAFSKAIMVGDTAFDVLGAAAHGIPTIGVSWGYGTVADMQQAGAMSIAETMTELQNLLIG